MYLLINSTRNGQWNVKSGTPPADKELLVSITVHSLLDYYSLRCVSSPSTSYPLTLNWIFSSCQLGRMACKTRLAPFWTSFSSIKISSSAIPLVNASVGLQLLPLLVWPWVELWLLLWLLEDEEEEDFFESTCGISEPIFRFKDISFQQLLHTLPPDWVTN